MSDFDYIKQRAKLRGHAAMRRVMQAVDAQAEAFREEDRRAARKAEAARKQILECDLHRYGLRNGQSLSDLHEAANRLANDTLRLYRQTGQSSSFGLGKMLGLSR